MDAFGKLMRRLPAWLGIMVSSVLFGAVMGLPGLVKFGLGAWPWCVAMGVCFWLATMALYRRAGNPLSKPPDPHLKRTSGFGRSTE